MGDKIKAVILDCDGVIVNSEPIRHETYRKLFLKEFNVRLQNKMDKNCLGRPEKENLACYMKKYKIKANLKKLAEKRHNLLRKTFNLKKNIKPIKGLYKLLDMLKKNKYKIAVASSSHKQYLNSILNHLKIKNKFNIIISGDMVKKGKPNPDIFLLAAKKLKVKPKECLVLEDAVNGIVAAKKAKMKAIALTTSLPKNMFKKADFIVKSLDQIKLKNLK